MTQKKTKKDEDIVPVSFFCAFLLLSSCRRRLSFFSGVFGCGVRRCAGISLLQRISRSAAFELLLSDPALLFYRNRDVVGVRESESERERESGSNEEKE